MRHRLLTLLTLASCTVVAAATASDAPPGLCCLTPTGATRAADPAAAQPAAGVVVLSFEGLQDLEPVGAFYGGAPGGHGSGPGPDLGIAFSSNALAVVDADAGGSGNFGGEPSPDTILFFLTGTAAVMNVPAGFANGFSFYYSAINFPGFIRVYDGVDATGTLLAELTLPLTPHTGAPDPSGQFSPLLPLGVAFPGIARSVDFGGTINQIGFDNITLGSDVPGGADPAPVPHAAPALSPLALLLAGSALVLVGLRRTRSPARRP